MSELSVEHASKSFGQTEVLRDVSLTVADGEFCVIVGPSGCGKSTLLRAVAGLEELDQGSISIGGKKVDGLPPAKRGIAMVFQSYALYPHLSLRENMAFALKLANKPKPEIDAAVDRAAAILGIETLLERKPAALSGGQRQRVAIGRAIVRQPEVFLFDEPLSNLDAALRVRMRFEFAALHRQLKTTTIYVTHDQVEAMTLADRIVVMRAGKIEQVGTPADLYERPDNLFVAGFIGSPQMNFLTGEIVGGADDRPSVRLDDGALIALPDKAKTLPASGKVTLGIRPEHLAASSDAGGLSRTAQFIERLGGSANIHLVDAAGEGELVWQQREPVPIAEGETIALTPEPAHIHLFNEAGTALLS
ncbi:MAG: sn-glycerol-3-phosphate ABC transporter ATP-binding protein UgpC [Sphingomonas bacterium]|nr:sn-glycerol-3-phosphate ABC transporter ATP-binding protein UgpC [Sphingomonas bacterium]